MAINGVAEKRVYHVSYIFREFLGHNFVFSTTLKLKKTKKNLKPKITKNIF